MSQQTGHWYFVHYGAVKIGSKTYDEVILSSKLLDRGDHKIVTPDVGLQVEVSGDDCLTIFFMHVEGDP